VLDVFVARRESNRSHRHEHTDIRTSRAGNRL
jgi:hypothetical protein